MDFKMNFKDVGNFIAKIIKFMDKKDDTARELIETMLPLLPKPYEALILFILSTEKKTVEFLVDLITDIEASDLKKEAKLEEAMKRCEGRTEGGLGVKDIAEHMICSVVGIFDSIVKGK